MSRALRRKEQRRKQHENGPIQKKTSNPFSIQIKPIHPKTRGQQYIVDAWEEGYSVMMHGCPGTGKTLLSMYLALKELKEERYEKIVIIRSAVSTRDQGFQPGTLKEKQAVYEDAYRSTCNSLCDTFEDSYSRLKALGKIQFTSTSFLRGITLENAIVYFDEAQNANAHEWNTVLSRVGENCKMLISGDYYQSDLITNPNDTSYILEGISRLEAMPEFFRCIELTAADIVRSGFCKAWILSNIAARKNKSWHTSHDSKRSYPYPETMLLNGSGSS